MHIFIENKHTLLLCSSVTTSKLGHLLKFFVSGLNLKIGNFHKSVYEILDDITIILFVFQIDFIWH